MAIARDTVVYQGVVSRFQQPLKAVGIGGWDSVHYFDADLLHLKYMDRLGSRNDVLRGLLCDVGNHGIF